MKKLLITLIGIASLGAALPAFAGPDWQVIEHGRKVKLARLQQEAAAKSQAGAQQGNHDAQKEKMMKQCKDMMNKSS